MNDTVSCDKVAEAPSGAGKGEQGEADSVRRARQEAPSILDVADSAQVSAATVSRYFNDPKIVRSATRARIAAAAQKLGYIRNRNAGSLHTRFSGTFGLVVPTMDNAIFAEMIEAFSNQLQSHERTLLIASHGYDLGLEASIVRSLLERRIDGIALIGLDHDAVTMNLLDKRQVPVVTVWNYHPDAVFSCVGVDNRQVGRSIAQHLVDLGHREIALLFPDVDTNDRARDRLAGVEDILGQHGCTWQRYACPYEVARSKALSREILQDAHYTAMIGGNDVIAQGAIYGAQSLGISVPESLSIVGIGDFRSSGQMEPSLTTVRLPAKRIGVQAAEILLSLSQNDEATDIRQFLKPELLIRASSGACRF